MQVQLIPARPQRGATYTPGRGASRGSVRLDALLDECRPDWRIGQVWVALVVHEKVLPLHGRRVL